MYAFGGGDGVNWLNDLYAYNLSLIICHHVNLKRKSRMEKT